MKFKIIEDCLTSPAINHSNKLASLGARKGYSEKTIRLLIENKDERWEEEADEIDLNIVSIDLTINEKTVNLDQASTANPLTIKPFDVDNSISLSYEYLIERFNDKNGTQLDTLKGGTVIITNEYEISKSADITF